MDRKIHFLSGLPRSGSTVLTAILRQNPAFSASISTALWEMFTALLERMSFSESAVLVTDAQRQRVLKSLVESYYAEQPPATVVLDKHRAWTASMPAITRLFPEARVICCVRSPARIADSVERLLARNALLVSKLFGPNRGNNVYQRVESMMAKDGMIGGPLGSLQQAWHSDQAKSLIAIRYDSLAAHPAAVMGRLYKLLDMEEFEHDFERLEHSEPEFDARLNTPGLHTVAGRVEAKPRQPILPPELFKPLDHCFWDAPGQNPRGVEVL